VLAVAMLLIAIAFAALARSPGRMLLGAARPNAVAITVPATVATALLVGLAASIVLGITAGPLAEFVQRRRRPCCGCAVTRNWDGPDNRPTNWRTAPRHS